MGLTTCSSRRAALLCTTARQFSADLRLPALGRTTLQSIIAYVRKRIHSLTCSRSPLVYNGVDPDPTTQPVQWTGHADIIQTASGEWYGVCLGIRPQGGNIARAQLGRETFLFPVQWKDGWPVFNDGKSIGLVGPGLRNRTFESTSWYDGFSAEGQSQLGLSYYVSSSSTRGVL
jgi:hypothetical protein